MNILELWEKRRGFIRDRTLDDFLLFLGIDKIAADPKLDDISNFPGVLKAGLLGRSENSYPELNQYIYSWNGCNGRHTHVRGRGSTYEEAAISGLLTYFEFYFKPLKL